MPHGHACTLQTLPLCGIGIAWNRAHRRATAERYLAVATLAIIAAETATAATVAALAMVEAAPVKAAIHTNAIARLN